MKRNDNAFWFDEGFSQGVRKQKIRSFVPRLVGYWSILITAYYYPSVALTFLIVYTGFEYMAHRDRKAERTIERPSTWEE